MTTPGGVPNLPAGALTLDNLASALQDTTPDAVKGRAVERFPSTFDLSTGGDAAVEFTPLGILNRIYAEIMSRIANADPADIQGPEDLPELFIDFIEDLPVVKQLVGLLDAIKGEYDGDDEVLLAIQQIFAPIRQLLQLVSGHGGALPTPEEILAGWEDQFENIVGLDDLGHFVDELFKGTPSPSNPFPPYGIPYTPGLGAALSDAQRAIANLKLLLDANFAAIDFDPTHWARNFSEDVLKPLKVFATLVGGKLPDVQAPPIVGRIIDAVGDGIDDVELFFERLKSVPGFNNMLSALWNADDAAIALIVEFLKPQGLLATLEGGKLPDIQAPQVINDIVAAIQSALAGLTNPFGGIAGAFWNAFQTIVSAITGNSGQIAIVQSNQDAGAAGSIWSTGFDGAKGAATFPNLVYDGGGTGIWVLEGDGTTRWTNMSSTPRRAIGMGLTAANTKYISAKVTITSSIEPVTPTVSSFCMMVRCNNARDQFALCTISDGVGKIEVISGGVTTQLGSTFLVPSTQPGQQWDFRAGTLADEYDYFVTLKPGGGIGVVGLRNDSGHIVSTANRRHGCGETTGANIYGGTLPPHLTSYSGGDFVPS